jgi:N-methylhydantoinase A
VPGPVCYARGGCQPTLTDANLLLGYLNPSALLGGQLPVDRALTEAVFRNRVAGPLGLDVLVAAYGIHQIAVGSMVRAVRAISSERGRDPRRFAFIAYGGNGPLHAVSAAQELGVPVVVVPPSPGVFSAFGLLAADPSQHAARSFLRISSELTSDELEAAYRELERRVIEILMGDGHAESEIELRRTIDVHYAGQSFELSLPIPASIDAQVVAELDERFSSEHERTYGHRAEGDPVEVVHIRAEGRVPAAVRPTAPTTHADFDPTTPEMSRPVYFGPLHGVLPTPVVARGQVGPEPWPGPLIVEEYDATSVIPPGCSISRDARNNLLITVSAAL